MTHKHDPATCDVAMLRDAADRKVAQIGTDCIEEEDLSTLDALEERAPFSRLFHGWFGWIGSPSVRDDLLEDKLSKRFLDVCEHFRSQGYHYLWLDADRETPIALADDTGAVPCEGCGRRFTPEGLDPDHMCRDCGSAREIAVKYLRFIARIMTTQECLKFGKDPRDSLANDTLILGARNALAGVEAPKPSPEPVNARLLAALKAIIYPDNERSVEFISAKEYYRAWIEGWELDRARAAIAEAERAAPVVIRLDIYHGVVGDPVGLPPGVELHVHDLDPNCGDTEPCAEHPGENCTVHKSQGGKG
jgi:hypothetical protein